MTWNVVPKKNLKPLVWEAQKLFSGYYYAPLSEDNKVHMQLVDESEGYVEPLIDQRLYCDMRPHVETQVEGDRVRACLFAIGFCTYDVDKKMKKDVPELAIIATVHSATLAVINDKLDAVVDGETDIDAFLENKRTGMLGYASHADFFSWDPEQEELKPCTEEEFAARYADILGQVGITLRRTE